MAIDQYNNCYNSLCKVPTQATKCEVLKAYNSACVKAGFSALSTKKVCNEIEKPSDKSDKSTEMKSTDKSSSGSGTIETRSKVDPSLQPVTRKPDVKSTSSDKEQSTLSIATSTVDGDINNIKGDKTKTDNDKVEPTAPPFSSKIPSVIPTGETVKEASTGTKADSKSTISPATSTDDGDIDNIEGDKTTTDAHKVKPTVKSSVKPSDEGKPTESKQTTTKSSVESTASPATSTDKSNIDNIEGEKTKTDDGNSKLTVSSVIPSVLPTGDDITATRDGGRVKPTGSASTDSIISKPSQDGKVKPTDVKSTDGEQKTTKSELESTAAPSTATDGGDIDNIEGDKTKTDEKTTDVTKSKYQSTSSSLVTSTDTGDNLESTADSKTSSKIEPTDGVKPSASTILSDIPSVLPSVREDKTVESTAEKQKVTFTQDGTYRSDKPISETKTIRTDSGRDNPQATITFMSRSIDDSDKLTILPFTTELSTSELVESTKGEVSVTTSAVPEPAKNKCTENLTIQGKVFSFCMSNILGGESNAECNANKVIMFIFSKSCPLTSLTARFQILSELLYSAKRKPYFFRTLMLPPFLRNVTKRSAQATTSSKNATFR